MALNLKDNCVLLLLYLLLLLLLLFRLKLLFFLFLAPVSDSDLHETVKSWRFSKSFEISDT